MHELKNEDSVKEEHGKCEAKCETYDSEAEEKSAVQLKRYRSYSSAGGGFILKGVRVLEVVLSNSHLTYVVCLCLQ